MKKNKWVLLGIVASILVGGGLFIRQMVEDGTVRVGFVNGDFPPLNNGTYEISELTLKPNRYAIYATAGSGRVSIDQETFDLNSDLLEDTKKRMKGVPDQMFYGLLYEESPRIMLSETSVIVVDGEEDFEISFITH